MSNQVRFFDADVVETVSGYYNDGSTADGTLGKGRFVLTVDPFAAPVGTDGQFLELDFVVDDPGDPAYVFWGWVGVTAPASPSLVTGGFTFDAAAPVGFDYWACFRDTKTDYDTYVAGNLVAGAANYARNNALFYDGAYQIQGLGFVVAVDGASAADWWRFATSATPVITAPAPGASFTPDDDLTVTVTWTEAGETHAQVRLSGATSFDSGTLGAVTSDDVVIPYGVSGTVTIEVRTQQTGKDWSPWASEDITVTPAVDTPEACFEAEALLDSPDVLWLFRDAVPTQIVTDLSGNGNDGRLESVVPLEDEPGHGSGSLSGGASDTITLRTTAHGGYGGANPPQFTTGWSVVAILVVVADAVPTLTLPAGWSIVATDDHVVTGFHTVGFVVTGPADAAYPWDIVASAGAVYGYKYALDVVPDWLTVRAGSAQYGAAGPANVPAPAAWTGYQMQWFGYFSPGAVNYIETLVPMTEWQSAVAERAVGIYRHARFNPANVTPAITYEEPATGPDTLEVWLIQIVLEDLGGAMSPVLDTSDTGICDAGCGDVNGRARFRPLPLGGESTGTDYLIEADGYDPSSLTEWTVEAVARVTSDWGAAVFESGAGDVFATYPAGAKTSVGDASVHPDGDPLYRVRATDCWVHVIAQSSSSPLDGHGNKHRVFVNGRLRLASTLPVSLPDFKLAAADVIGEADVCVSAVYPSVMSKARIAAHVSHFCALCRAGRGLVLGSFTLN